VAWASTDVFFCGISVAGGTLEYVLLLRYFLMFNILTCQCSMIFLWLQRYYMSARSSSPVYGVAFDPCQLFAVLDQSLHVLDFSVFRDTPGIRNPQYTIGWMPWWCWVFLGQFHSVISLSSLHLQKLCNAHTQHAECTPDVMRESAEFVPTYLLELYWYPKLFMRFIQ